MNRSMKAAFATLVCLAAPQGVCASDADLRAQLLEVREQLRELREGYERRIDALERSLRTAERKPDGGARAESAPPPPRGAAAAGVSPGASAFNPALSLILSGTYANLSKDPQGYSIGGFIPSGGEVAPPRRGASLAESELVFSANVDPFFRGTLIAALAPDGGVEVEEANVQSIGLGGGLTLKAGRFLSGVGYLNQVHSHARDFADESLAHRAFLGGRLAEDGVQLRWIAPTEILVEFGVELGRGRGFPGSDRARNGVGAAAAFARVGGDIGASYAWQAGLSWLGTRAGNRNYEDPDSSGTTVTNAFNGSSRLWVLDGVLKWAPGGNPTEASFKLQGEYFGRVETGSLTYDTEAASLGTQSGSYSSRQSGWYLQGVWQLARQWRLGLRHDRLDAGSTDIGLVRAGVLSAADFPMLAAHRPSRNTLMTDWSASEFSRIRVQLARDRSRRDAPDNQLLLQYVMSLGAHGAHRF